MKRGEFALEACLQNKNRKTQKQNLTNTVSVTSLHKYISLVYHLVNEEDSEDNENERYKTNSNNRWKLNRTATLVYL